MDNSSLVNTIKTLEENLSRYENKDFNVYFFVLDTKGNPSATLRYVYQTALTLKNMGYKVAMLHQEDKFVGVEQWLGEKFASLPHMNVKQQNVEISASDILFIPEIYANVMSQTKNLPCRRIALLTNMNYLTEVIPVGVTWFDMGINEAVVSTKNSEKAVKEYFPGLKTHVVSPYIPAVFRKNTEPQDLIVNIISKDPSDINKIIKPFFWKYPVYKWVSFRDLRGLPQETFADALREAAFTIWVDDDTNFGASLLEAVRSGGIVLAKLPKVPTEWMVDEKGLLHGSIVWFDDLRKVPDVIASVVRTWLIDEIPHELQDEAEKLNQLYTREQHEKEVLDEYVNGIFESRKKEITEAIEQFKTQLNKEQSK